MATLQQRHTGTLFDTTGTAQTDVLQLPPGFLSIAFQVAFASTGSVSLQYSVDGVVWGPISIEGTTAIAAVTANATIFIKNPPAGLYRGDVTANGSGAAVKYRMGGEAHGN